MAQPLYTAQSRALQMLHSDLESYGLGRHEVFVGTAGSVIRRENASRFRFYAHQLYDGDGRKRERYLAGPIGSPEADAAADNLRERIRELKDLVPSFRLLGREGFHLVDRKTYATIASLHNHGLFIAGGMLIGSHAYGVLLNRLGVRAAPYATEDIDIARREALAFESLPEPSFLDMLKDSGIEFVEVPYLDYLLAESQMAMLLAREGCCAVRVPLPERFAIHKLVISQLRRGRDAKSGRDVRQACVVAAVLGETHPGAIESAVKQLPKRARERFRKAREAARRFLESDHPRAWEELQG